MGLLKDSGLKLADGEWWRAENSIDYINMSYGGDDDHESFVIYQYKEMIKLNNFFYLTYDASDRYASLPSSIRGEYTDIIMGDNVLTKEAQQKIEAMDQERFSDYGFSNDEVSKLYAPASCLTILYFFTIAQLKELNKKFNSKAYKNWNPNHSKKVSEFNQLLELLSNHLQLDIRGGDMQQIDAIMVACKDIRNKFAHGDFIGVEDKIRGLSIKRSLNSVSNLLRLINDAISEKNIIKLD
jgi:hypothetical protein